MTTLVIDNLTPEIQKLGCTKASEWLIKNNYWQTALALGDCMDGSTEQSVKDKCAQLITDIREMMGAKALSSKEPTIIEFGTSGWRGRIGEEFTVFNVHKVVRAIIEMMKTPEFLFTNCYSSFEEVQKNGIVVFRDNRYLGDTFMEVAMNELAAAHIRIYNAGECPTGVGSAIVTMLSAAGSINFTPSHNPMDAAGLKFNPADGGPADKKLTDIIQALANQYMQTPFSPANLPYQAEAINPAKLYEKYLASSKIINLPRLRKKVLAQKNNLSIIVDNMHGASRGIIEQLLGEEVIKNISIQFINTNTDYSFHGVKPEPSAKNQKQLLALLNKNPKQLNLAVALDPDADRIRFCDHLLDLDMNMFASIALKYLLDNGMRQGVATSVASSGFALAIARKENLPITETPVGFKNFRKPLIQKTAAIAYEESDGISFLGHTLEKDGIIGFLVALAAIAKYNQNLSELFLGLQEKYGYYYPGKSGEELPGITIAEWQVVRKKVDKNIQNMFAVGNSVTIDGKQKKIQSINTADGAKFVFEDNSWILLRASGTEAKFRYYYETSGKNSKALLPEYQKAASHILKKAMAEI